MKKLQFTVAILFVLTSQFAGAQSVETTQQYITQFKDVAILEEIRTGVPAAITLAQGIHETGAGTSYLVISSNNHFGIKCKGDWTGAKVFHDDDAKGECFRKYDDPLDSYKDHSDFLKNRPYYAALFQLDPTDYKAWANGLKKAGYATNPKYAQILIRIIETYNLQEYTLIALGVKKPADNTVVWVSHSEREKLEDKEMAPVKMLPAKTIVNYPSGIFRINETKVVFVLRGTAYLKIAAAYDLSLSRLFEFNDMKPADIAEKDELIYVQRKRKIGPVPFHTVQEGETLHDIAQVEGIRIENLYGYNLLQPGMKPMVGEQVHLQAKATSMPMLEIVHVQQTASITNPVIVDQKMVVRDFVHIVQPNETVYAIARKYAVGIDDIMKWNELQHTELKTGQQLRINKKTADGTY